jgi:hypothetical protein
MIRSSASRLAQRVAAPVTAPIMAALQRVHRESDRLAARVRKLGHELVELRQAMRLTQAQVAALARTMEAHNGHRAEPDGGDSGRLRGRAHKVAESDIRALTSRVPLTAPAGPVLPDIALVARCGVCGSSERTIVLEFNRFAMLDTAPDEPSRQYDYAVCHGCGVLYASRRPVGARYRALLEGFQETLGRVQRGMPHDRHPMLYPYPLSDDERQVLTRRASAGVWQSEHEPRRRDAMPHLWRDRLANAPHIELLSSLAPVRGAAVLELRPRSGAIGAALRERFDASVDILPLFESQAVIAESAYGLTPLGLLDYETFDVPGDRTYDLVVGNHLLVHAVRPERFFQMLRDRVRPGGHVYVYNEPDDAEYLVGTASAIRVLNAFHLQAFDAAALQYAFGVNGFATRFLAHTDGYNFALLAERAAEGAPAVHAVPDVQGRVTAYQQARLSALLRALPESERLVACDWPAVTEQAIACGLAELDSKGRVKLRA